MMQSNKNTAELVFNEFQLTELEERLEMTSVSSSQSLHVCCDCLPGSYCTEDRM
jgi:hypothetical protein